MNRLLDSAWVDDAVFALRPDYRVVLMTVDGLTGGPSDAASEIVLAAAERQAPSAHRHLDEWREAFRGFGAKPQRTRPSVDALLRRVETGLPRIDHSG